MYTTKETYKQWTELPSDKSALLKPVCTEAIGIIPRQKENKIALNEEAVLISGSPSRLTWIMNCIKRSFF